MKTSILTRILHGPGLQIAESVTVTFSPALKGSKKGSVEIEGLRAAHAAIGRRLRQLWDQGQAAKRSSFNVFLRRVLGPSVTGPKRQTMAARAERARRAAAPKTRPKAKNRKETPFRRKP